MLNISGIEDILPRHQEISNGSKKDYTVAFDLIDTKFVSVYLGSEKQTTGYSVDIENKKVTFNSAPTTGLLVTIVRVVPASWESELHGALNSNSLNILFTKIIASLQTIKEEVNRSLKSNVFDENNSEQKFEFFLKQLADAQDVLTRSENNLSLLETTGQDSLNSINTARDNALEDIEEIRSETISEVTELTSSLLDYSNITNCITEIPQDIKLELKDGTLTLKAGSKLTWGGTEYRTTTTTADQTYSYSGPHEGKALIFSARSNGTIQGPVVLSRVSSGKLEDRPATATIGSVYYSTDDMKFNYCGSSGWSEWPVAYPLALVTITGSKITSLDQVFNGFGYIGSTVYALPGVKGLKPNGRNVDGSLRNVEFTVNKVLTNTTYRPSTNGYLICAGNAAAIQKSAVKSNWYYDEDNNYVSTLAGDKSWMIWGEYTTDINDIITSFQPKLPFRAVDYNDMQLKQDEATAVNYDNITNCITEIPQDIKLELNNGTLTLKAGSKVYVPNGKNADGSNKFDVLIVDVDKQAPKAPSGKLFFIINSLSKNIAAFTLDTIYSGSEPPVSSVNNILWYDTENNFIKNSIDQGVTWSNKMGLPLCAYTAENTVVTSIDQVFNGFGYIGSTIFALPGVKGLIPNGRNADGSLKNIEVVLTKIATTTYKPSMAHSVKSIMTPSVISSNGSYRYDEESNYIYNGSSKQSSLVFAETTFTSTGITSFQPKLPFRAVDQDDFNKLDSEVAKLDEENTFTNTNTFKAIGLRVKSERYDSNTNPASTQYDSIIYLLDKYGVNLGGVNSYLDTNGNLCIFLQGRRLVNDSVVYSPRLGVTLTPDGVGRTEAFTPPAGDNSSQIATTEWCYDPTKSTNLLHRTGDETISGTKTFTSEIRRSAPFSGGNTYSVKTIDTNGKGETSTISYYTGSSIYHRFYAKNTTSNKDVFIDVTATDNGAGALTLSGSATQKYVNFQGVTKVRVPTPSSSAESGEAVNISYLNSVMPTITYWD